MAPAIIDLVGKYKNAQNIKKALFDTAVGDKNSIYNEWARVEPGASHVLNLAKETAGQVLTAKAAGWLKNRDYINNYDAMKKAHDKEVKRIAMADRAARADRSARSMGMNRRSQGGRFLGAISKKKY